MGLEGSKWAKWVGIFRSVNSPGCRFVSLYIYICTLSWKEAIKMMFDDDDDDC